MAKFCGKCGSPLNNDGSCPKCDAQRVQNVPQKPDNNTQNVGVRGEKPAKKSRHLFPIILIIVLALVIVFAGVVGVLAYFDYIDIPLLDSVMGLLGSDGEPSTEQATEASEEGYDIALSLQNFKGNVYEIPVGGTELVLFTTEISAGQSAGSDEIILETVDGTFLGYMNDDGENGDALAKDGIYSFQTEVFAEARGSKSYRSAYYKAVSNTFDIFCYEDIPEESYEAFYDVTQTASSMNSLEEALNYIAQSDIIESYNVDGNKITFTSYYGMTGIYEYIENEEMKGGGAYSVSDAAGIDYGAAYTNLRDITYVPTDNVDNEDIVAIRPFRSTQFQYDDFSYAGQILSTFTNGNLKLIDDSAATVDAMKRLDKYKIVLIDSHGTLSNVTNSAWDVFSGGPYLLTGEEYSAGQMWSSADWQASRIVVCGTNVFSGKGYVAVGAKFFDRYYENGSLDGSMFFLGTCYSMYDNSIAEALCSKGAEVVYGYTNPVSTTYCNETLFETVINSMLLSAYTSNEAFSEARRIYGNNDPYSSDCEYAMYGANDYIIAEEPRVSSGERDVVLVLDVSSSMRGTPLTETKNAATSFIETVLQEDANIGIVTYNDSSAVVSEFSTHERSLKNVVDNISATGGTNIESGLANAYSMLENSEAKKKIIVLMSDGQPNRGKVGDELVDYADEIKDDDIIIYTLGFFESLNSDKAAAQTLMQKIASDGCHYEVASADDLVFFFGDMADQINGQRYIYIRIACPVDVSVTSDGQTLSSAEKDLNTRTDFGTLSFEDNEDEEYDSVDNQIKVLRLKEGTDYDLEIVGTGRGIMNYTIGFMDEEGSYSDFREFENIKITKNTVIDTVAAISDETVLNVDQDGDGKYDLTLRAEKNGYGEEVKTTNSLFVAAFVGIGVLLLIIIILIIIFIIKSKNKKRRAGK